MLISSRFSPPSSLVSSSIVRIAPADRKDPRSAIPVASLPAYFNVSFAIQHGYFRCVRYLLQLRHDPNERDKQCRTPLILCAYVESDPWSLSLAQNLLEKGAKIALEDQHKRNPYVDRTASMDSFDLLLLECIMPVLFNGCNWSNSSSPAWISILERKT